MTSYLLLRSSKHSKNLDKQTSVFNTKHYSDNLLDLFHHNFPRANTVFPNEVNYFQVLQVLCIKSSFYLEWRKQFLFVYAKLSS